MASRLKSDPYVLYAPPHSRAPFPQGREGRIDFPSRAPYKVLRAADREVRRLRFFRDGSMAGGGPGDMPRIAPTAVRATTFISLSHPSLERPDGGITPPLHDAQFVSHKSFDTDGRRGLAQTSLVDARDLPKGLPLTGSGRALAGRNRRPPRTEVGASPTKPGQEYFLKKGNSHEILLDNSLLMWYPVRVMGKVLPGGAGPSATTLGPGRRPGRNPEPERRKCSSYLDPRLSLRLINASAGGGGCTRCRRPK